MDMFGSKRVNPTPIFIVPTDDHRHIYLSVATMNWLGRPVIVTRCPGCGDTLTRAKGAAA